jgi:hypothetical protein
LVHYRLTMKGRRCLGDGNDGDHLFSHKSQTDEFNHRLQAWKDTDGKNGVRDYS